MDLIMGRSMDRFLHLMEVGMNNLLTSQGPPYYGTSTSPYMGQTGGGHYGQGHGGAQTYVNQGAVHRPHHPRPPFLATLNLPDLSRLKGA